MAEAIPLFATLLKQWRAHRHLSQLDLAGLTGVSQRHLSFLETGRANPSRPMVLALANYLDVPLRERNSLLQSAGFNAAFSEGDLDADSHRLFKHALEQNLEHHEPYPAVVLDGRWNMVLANAATMRFFGLFVDPLLSFDAIGNPEDFQIVRLCLHEDGLKPYIVNWEELISSFLSRARRAHLANPKDDRLRDIINEMLDHPDAPADWRQVWTGNPAPAVEMIMRKNAEEYRLFTMLAHFGTPSDITLEELSLELFYPADDQTRLKFEQLAG